MTNSTFDAKERGDRIVYKVEGYSDVPIGYFSFLVIVDVRKGESSSERKARLLDACEERWQALGSRGKEFLLSSCKEVGWVTMELTND